MKTLFKLVFNFFAIPFYILYEMVFSLLMDSDSYKVLQEIKFYEEILDGMNEDDENEIMERYFV